MPVWKENAERINVTFHKENTFMCIEYPGIVQNPEKAIATFGGEDKINKVYSDPSKRLPLRWRPEDVYCKAAFGDRVHSNSLLMRVRRRRKKSEDAKFEYQVEVLGIVNVTYKFQGMSDFQYLPMEKKDTGQYESIYEKVVLNKLTSRKDYFERDAPLFMPPLSFSRIDTPCDFLLKTDIEHRTGYSNPDTKRAPHLIGTVRQKRTIYTIFVNFGEPVPEKPIEAAVKRLKSKYVNPQWEMEVRKLFDEKPLFLKAELMRRLNCGSDHLKICLPAVCFYWLDGPWRAQWNKFGFDPTKNIEAKIYQTVDFRIRAFKPGQKQIKPKRLSFEVNRWNHQTKIKPPVAKITVASLSGVDNGKKEKEKNNSDQEVFYKFFPDKLPPHRLMYYQLCQIELDEVKKLIHENDGRETVCSEKDGWCIITMTDRCRDIMYKYTERLLSTDLDEAVQESFHHRLKHKRRPAKMAGIDEDEDDDDETYNEPDIPMEMDDG